MKTSILKYLSASLLAAALSGSAYALPTTGTLLDLVNNNGSIAVGDKTFSNFSFNAFNLTSFDASAIDVTASNLGNVYYLTWGGNMSFAGTGTADLKLNYRVTASAGKIDMIDQSYTGSGQGVLAFASVDETVYGVSPFSLSPVASSHLDLSDHFDPAGEAVQGDNLNTAPGYTVLDVTKDIGFAAISGFVSISEVKQSFHQNSVPEGSATAGLLGVSLIALAVAARRKRSHA